MTKKEKAIKEYADEFQMLGNQPVHFIDQIIYMNKMLDVIGKLYDKGYVAGFDAGFQEKVIQETK